MPIPKHIIDRIYETVKIDEVVSDYVSLRRKGANLWGCCPFHDEKTPSFSVSPAKGIFKCFGCGKAGNAVTFVKEYENCSYSDALRQLANRYHIQFEERELTPEEKTQQDERESLFAVNQWANKWFQQQLHETQDGNNIGMTYFIERGVREDIIKKFQLGYAPDKNILYYDAIKAGYKEEFLTKTGLCGLSEHNKKHYDRFRDRVIFPIFSVSGKVVAFAGRILVKKENTGKYVNSPESAIYSKQNELYGLFQAKSSIARQQLCYLVEGQMDVISMVQAGVENVVSSGGTSLTKNQIKKLHQFTNNIVVLYDGDNAGIHAALRGIDMIIEEGMDVKVILLPDGEDPDSFSKKMNANDFQYYLKQHTQDFIQFKAQRLLSDAGNDIAKRSQAINDIIHSIALIANSITRNIYVSECAKITAVKEDILLREVNKERKDYYSKKTLEKEKVAAAELKDHIQNTKENKDNTPQEQKSKYYQRYIENVENLIRVLIKYGTQPFYDYTVGQYIIEELEADQITFGDSIYQTLIQDYKNYMDKPDFNPEEHFTFHLFPEISTFVINLISDKYELSKIYSKQNISENVKSAKPINTEVQRLPELLPKLINELKLTLIRMQLEELTQQLRQALQLQQETAQTQIIIQQKYLKEVEKQLCQHLGNRY